MNIERQIISSLLGAGIKTAHDLLSTSPIVLMTVCQLSFAESRALQEKASSKILPKPQSALELLRERQRRKVFLPTGIPRLDAYLKGGLPLGTLTDICAPPGLGKTQLAMQIIVHLVSQSLKESLQRQQSLSRETTDPLTVTDSELSYVLYFDSELKLDPTRLLELARELYPDLYSYNHDASHCVDLFLKNIHIWRPMSLIDFEKDIAKIEYMVAEHKIELVVIDSMAAIVRKEGLDERAKETFFISMVTLP
jgi:RecA/RadA recombinase